MKKMPARALTRMWWYGSRIPLVPVVREVVLGCFCIMFGVKRQEAEEPDIRKYSSLHSFFTRRLSKEVRPICPEHSLVRPATHSSLHYLHTLIPSPPPHTHPFTTSTHSSLHHFHTVIPSLPPHIPSPPPHTHPFTTSTHYPFTTSTHSSLHQSSPPPRCRHQMGEFYTLERLREQK